MGSPILTSAGAEGTHSSPCIKCWDCVTPRSPLGKGAPACTMEISGASLSSPVYGFQNWEWGIGFGIGHRYQLRPSLPYDTPLCPVLPYPVPSSRVLPALLTTECSAECSGVQC